MKDFETERTKSDMLFIKKKKYPIFWIKLYTSAKLQLNWPKSTNNLYIFTEKYFEIFCKNYNER